MAPASPIFPFICPTDDPQTLAALDAQCFAEPWSAADYRSLLDNPAVTAWVLTLGGEAGGLLCFQRLGDEAELYRIGIVRARRKAGWGAYLLERFLEEGRGTGLRQVVLEVRGSNAPALGLYRGAGFAEIGRRPVYYHDPPEDALVLAYRFPDPPPSSTPG